MEKTPIFLSLELETAFRGLYPPIDVSRDGFEISPTKEISAGLEKLCSAGIIKTEELPALLERFDFGTANLRCVMADESSVKELQELVSMLKKWAKELKDLEENEI